MARRILVADDDREIQEIVKFKLQPTYEVDTVGDGEACWEYLREHAEDPPDLLVLDVMMPGMDGYQVLERIRDDQRLADLSVIVLTSRGQEDDVVRTLDMGASDHVTKPFSPNELQARIEQALE